VPFPEPVDDLCTQVDGKVPEFIGFARGDFAGGIVFEHVALAAAGIEVVGAVLPDPAQDHRRGGDGSMVGVELVRLPYLGQGQDGTELKGGLIGDVEAAVR
jgi:hypothetical protein